VTPLERPNNRDQGPAKGGIFWLLNFCKIQNMEYSEYSVYVKIITSKSNFYFREILVPTWILIENSITSSECRALTATWKIAYINVIVTIHFMLSMSYLRIPHFKTSTRTVANERRKEGGHMSILKLFDIKYIWHFFNFEEKVLVLV
jgi:hypothetical protein